MFNINLPPQFQDFITIFLSIFVEAMPFVILGSLVSALIGLFIKEEWILKLIPKNRLFSHALMPFLGIAFPVCECGNVPVAKRLLFKGVQISQVLTFILAAPAFNFIVFIATYSAFKDSISIVFFRFLFTYIIAVTIGILFSLKKNPDEILQSNFANEVACHHDHTKKSLKNFSSDLLDDFSQMLASLVIGALIASALQNFTPIDILKSLGQNPIISILIMIIIAFVISICSNVDAFVALSYSSRFTSGSIVSFLVFGPMIDIKSLSMLSTIFTKRFLILMTSLVFALTFILSLILNFYIF